MKIAIFSETRIWGGLEVHAVALAEILAEGGDDVSIACIGGPTYELYKRWAPSNVQLLQIEPPGRRTVFGWWRALRHIDADGAVLEKGTLATGGLALDIVLRARYRRFVAIMQLEPPPMPARSSQRHYGGLIPGLGLWWYRRRLLGMARSWAPVTTVCVSHAIRRRLISEYGFRASKVVTIHNGVDPAAFQPQPDQRGRARAAWAVPDNAIVFGTVGRLSDQKALDIAIQALRTLIDAQPELPAFLVCVGEGAERERLVGLSRRLKLDGRVRLPGFSGAPAEAYQGIDVFLIPSRYEGLPFALVEALASGCVVVGSRVGGIPEVISDPRFGTLVPPEDPDALAHAMLEVASLAPEVRAARSLAGREHAATFFEVRTQLRKVGLLLASPRQRPQRATTPDVEQRTE